MSINTILLYFSLTFILVECIRLFPPKLALLPKMLQMGLLLTAHILVLFVFRQPGLAVTLTLLLATLLFTLAAGNLKKYFYARFLSSYLEQRNLPEWLFALNWDFHTLGLVKLKAVFKALEAGDQAQAVALAAQAARYPGLARYMLWYQDLLQLLHYTLNITLAKSYIEILGLDLSRPNLPYGLVSTIMNIHLADNNCDEAFRHLKYLDAHYCNPQYYTLNLMNAMFFFAHTGDSGRFEQLAAAYPALLQNRSLDSWRIILLLKRGEREAALRLLGELKAYLPAGNTFIIRYVEWIAARNDGAVQAQVQVQVYDFFPAQPGNPALLEAKSVKHIPAVYVLCGLTVVLTVLQFLLVQPASLNAFFQQTRIFELDFIRAGAYSWSWVMQGQWVRFVTAMFLHGNWLHLLLNVYSLFVVGRFVARAYGSWNLFFIFLLSGITGFLFSFLAGQAQISVGASGGVLGLLAAMVLYIVRNRRSLHKSNFYRFLVNFGLIIVINIVFGLQNPIVNNLAHLGGFIGGGLVGLLCLLPVKQIVAPIARVLTILIAVTTAGLWPSIVMYDYQGKTALGSAVQAGGYTLSLPSGWEKDETDRIIDPATGTLISLVKITTGYSTGRVEDFLRAQVQPPAEFVTEHELSEQEFGWYMYGMKPGKPDLQLYEHYYIYSKLFPSSLCWVNVACFSKYAAGNERLLARLLGTVKEAGE